jgi:hypothetical protein
MILASAGTTVTQAASISSPGTSVLYQNHYVWFVFVSALDVMLTWVVLFHDGFEANLIADFIIGRYGLGGLVLYKFAIVAFVVCLCEVIGRRRYSAGRRLATWAVAITCVPVAMALAQLLIHALRPVAVA